MNKKTLVTVIVSAITFILLVINTVFNTNFEIPADAMESIGVLIATLIMFVINHYYNHDYSSVARKITPIMRKIKVMVKAGDVELLDAVEQLVNEWSDGNDD